MRSQPLGAVVVGAGLMGRWHAHAAARSGARVLTVVDSDITRARSLASRHQGCEATASLDSALQKNQPQVVHICTPTETHDPIARRALDAGCHLLVEKPLASTLLATEQLIEFAASRRRLLCPVHQFVFQRGVLKTCVWLPAMGAVRHADVVICSAGAGGVTAEVRDQIAVDVLPHALSLFARLLGPQFSGLSWRVDRPDAGEIRATGSGAGVTTGILVSMSGRPTMNLLRVITERGSVHCDLFHGFATREHGTVSRRYKIVRPLVVSGAHMIAAASNLARRLIESEYAYPGLAELVGRFNRAVSEGGSSPITPAETLAVAAAGEAILAPAIHAQPRP
jgi:predicted dehydrogenase